MRAGNWPRDSRRALVRSATVLLLAAPAIALLAGLGRPSLSVFTDQRTVGGNTFTTAASFATATPAPSATPTPTLTPTATPTPTSTGYLSPAAQAADTGGDGDGYEGSPASAFANDGIEAEDRDSGTDSTTSCGSAGKDRHRFYNYSISIPASATVNGIEVQLGASRVDSTAGAPFICVELSWDGGTTWTAAKTTPTLTTTRTSYILGSASDTWGRSWTASTDFTNANFRVRITDVASDTLSRFRLDWVAAKITYTP